MATKTKSKAKPEDKQPRRYRVENFVKPLTGPHKGMRHKVIHVHEDGSVNIVPWDMPREKVKYRMGVAHAQLHQLEPAWLKESTEEEFEDMEEINEQSQTGPSEGREHVIMQLRKVVSTGGMKHVEFATGEKHEVSPMHAQRVLDHYASLPRPADKEKLQAHIDKSHANFHEVASKGKLSIVKEAIERIKAREIPSDPIFGIHEGYRQHRTIRRR